MTAGGRPPASGNSPGGDASGRGGDDAEGITSAEKAVMAISAAFTIGLFVFALWHAATGPGGMAPRATVVDSRPASGGDVVHTVELRNPGDLGLISVTVEAACTDPPVELQFEHVPPGGRRVGTVACPAGTEANLSVSSWIRE